MKVYMMTDFEGISGVRTIEEVRTGTAKYEAARKFLCGDVNAAVAGAFDGGATEVLVRDGHASGFNFVLEMMDPRALYTGPGGGSWCPMLDESFDAAFLVGAHAMAGTPNAFLEHTMSSTSWLNYSINGRKFGEQGMFAAVCGYFGIPLVLVTGDEAACAEAREFFPGCETVAVKYAINRNSAVVIHPEKAQQMIREAAKRALKPAGKVEPLKIDYPAEVVLEFTRSDYADTRADTSGLARVDARTVKWTANNAVELRV